MPNKNEKGPDFTFVRPYEVEDSENRSRRIIGVEILYKSQIPVWARGLEIEFAQGRADHRRKMRDFVAAQLERELPGYRNGKSPGTPSKPKHMGNA